MSGYRLPAPQGVWLDRTQPIRFAFNGRSVDGFAGDTVASALLAQGIGFVGRSFKLHRPRGIFSCGVEEPTGLVDVGEGAGRSANTRATDILARNGLVAASGNCWPSLEFDLAAINSRFAAFLPAGFYYKTFMWPNWHLFEPVIRRMAGLGVAGTGADPDRYDEVSVNTEVLVVGAGLAGIQAALAAARAGRHVMLLEADVQAARYCGPAATPSHCWTRHGATWPRPAWWSRPAQRRLRCTTTSWSPPSRPLKAWRHRP
jgi:sarcosine oxidase subunit alpha